MISEIQIPCAPSRFDELEAEIAKMPAVDVPVVNHFAPGVYAREMQIPAGVMLTGKIHKTQHLNIVLGDITVFNDEDGSAKRITGHAIFSSQPGTRRAGFAHANTSWTTIHPTDETDVAKIEDQVIEKYDNPLLTNGRVLQ